jgi:hypothetical protein
MKRLCILATNRSVKAKECPGLPGGLAFETGIPCNRSRLPRLAVGRAVDRTPDRNLLLRCHPLPRPPRLAVGPYVGTADSRWLHRQIFKLSRIGVPLGLQIASGEPLIYD